jgi:hypothetical protein
VLEGVPEPPCGVWGVLLQGVQGLGAGAGSLRRTGAGFLTAFLAGAFFTGFFLAGFLAAGFLAAGFFAGFLAAGFLAAGFFAGFLAAGFLAAGFFADFLAAGFFVIFTAMSTSDEFRSIL